MMQTDKSSHLVTGVTFPEFKLNAVDFADPITFFYHEHARHKKICTLLLEEQMIEEICYSKNQKTIQYLHQFFTSDLPNHIKDEEAVLFPLMVEKSTFATDAKAIIEQVQKEHEFDRELTDFIINDIVRLHQRGKLANPLRLALNLQTFAEGLIRHTNWENLTVLPLAEKLLGADDCKEMGRKMAQRRCFD